MKDYLTIGEVSKITNLPISTLRYYDSEGIISPSYKDEDTNYRYYSFFQIPIIKMIVYLKKLGFSKAKIKSHLENVSYSHTLELMNKMLEQTKKEIVRLQELEEELVENATQMRYLITLENNMDRFFIEEEEIRGIYAPVAMDKDYVGISKAFKELDSFLVSTKQNLVPMGMYAFTIKEEEMVNRSYAYDKLILLKDYEEYGNRCYYPKKKYASTVCQSKFDEIRFGVDKMVKWVADEGYEIDGDTVVHILSGPAFEKDPTDLKYIVRVPIK
ncbi:MerR family transcriptional regulator [Fusobacterium sp.]|uniref:MerR family transcriptional regulator n=1 Tax=Fusobacterium sp. TaxID=68766 RepID=UPI0025BEC523|nr:MerR family transcriptional regulator [Fusobacterium sp.]